jgi:hypothetical protein
VGERVGWPESSKDAELRGCVICSCVLKLKVHLPLDAIDNAGLNFPDFCWQKV